MKALVSIALALVAVALLPAAALAHTGYYSSTPAKSESIVKEPNAVDIWFTLALSDHDNQALSVTDEQGQVVAKGPIAVDAKDHTHVQLALPPGLANGRYTVSWKVVAADTMYSEGSYRFYLGVQPSQAQLDDDAALVEKMAIPRDQGGSSKTPLFAGLGGAAAVVVIGLSFVIWRGMRTEEED